MGSEQDAPLVVDRRPARIADDPAEGPICFLFYTDIEQVLKE
jgi:hypothetical protein